MNQVNQKFLILAICLLFIIIPVSLPFCLYAQDGYHLWFPIIAEYLRGDLVYHSSAVIFDGQNLAALYGELPFWKLFRLIGLPVHTFLNATHSIWMILLFLLLLPTHKGLKGHLKNVDVLFLALIAAFSPIVVNRIMAGHLNLLYGTLPFFAGLSLIFSKRWYNILLLIFSLWCALSSQAYQLLTYHIFYLPILGYLVHENEQKPRKYLLLGLMILVIAFGLNYQLFSEMLHFALDPKSTRNINDNIVYSYLVTSPLDFPHLLINTRIPLLQTRPLGFYHEINYSAGAFLLLLLGYDYNRRFKLIFGVTILLLLGFSMNLPGINLISELPLMKAFRVPQRALMVPMLFLPVYCYSRFRIEIGTYEFLVYLLAVIASQFFDYADIFWLILFMVFLMGSKDQRFESKRDFLMKGIIITAMISLFPAAYNKLKTGHNLQLQFEQIASQLAPLNDKYDSQIRRRKVFHFESEVPAIHTYVAQTLGFRTMEGYGHPPREFLEVFASVTGKNSISNNQLYFSNQPNKEELMKAFYVEIIVKIDRQGKVSIQDL